MFGDVVAIYDYDTSDATATRYVYDAWGNHKVLTPEGDENIDPLIRLDGLGCFKQLWGGAGLSSRHIIPDGGKSVKDRKVILNVAWFFDICWIAVTGLCLWVMISLHVGQIEIVGDEHEIKIGEIAIYVMMSFIPILFFLLLGVFNQAVVFNDQEIYTRNLYKVIRRIKWEDVTEIKKVKLAMNPLDPKILSWLIFVDKDGKQACKTSVNVKGDYIRARATRKVLKYIEENHPDIPIV